MSDLSPRLGLPYILPAQAQKHVTHNEALRVLDALTQLSVLAADLTAPPPTPEIGDSYIVAAGGTGSWAGKDTEIAIYGPSGWVFVTPRPGWRADIVPTGDVLRFDGGAWTIASLSSPETFGINATADTVNRLSVSAPATLLNHEGAGHQLKLNKAAATDTASLLFQTNWSGRAEMGTTGSDDFAIKVSADGATFRDAMALERATGAMRLPAGQIYMEDVFILNDSVYSFDVPFSNPARILMWLAINIIGHHFLFSISGTLTGATNFAEMFTSPPGKLSFQTGALTGTTGPDGCINLSIDASGATPRMYVENRIGSNRLFTLATLGK